MNTKIDSRIELLFDRMKIVEPYPDGIRPVDKMLNITAFFPGGKGLWLEDKALNTLQFMIIGNEFSTYDKYCQMKLGLCDDLASPTWKNLIKLFIRANINLNNCFYTNAYMGLKEKTSMIAPANAYKNADFQKRNVEFLLLQIDIIQPEVMITLGKNASIMLSKLSPVDLDSWSKGKALSEPNNGLKSSVRIKNKIYTCAALEHPSMRNSNIKRRVYTDSQNNTFIGDDAEVKMLIEANSNCRGPWNN